MPETYISQSQTPAMMQQALINILEDFSNEKDISETNQKALLNILDDFVREKEASENMQKAVINIMEDFMIEKSTSDDIKLAVINILEDFMAEKQSSEETQKAVLNILDDFNQEKLKTNQTNTELITANKSLESFSYTISHDLRNPLRAVNGFTKMLEIGYSHLLDAEGRRLLSVVQERVDKMGKLIDGLLDFSRLGKRELIKKEVNMDELITNVLLELSKTMLPAHATIRRQPLHPIIADESLMEQVMLNLIGNAIKYSYKKEHPVISIYSEQNNGDVTISVTDNGAGFNMKYIDKLFGVFQRLHDEDEFAGTGVGLAIVDRIVSRHGGKVWARGEVNKGATFSFNIPYKP